MKTKQTTEQPTPPALVPATGSVRLVEVTMKFWKVFHVEAPEGVTESDVLECEMVEDESGRFGDIDVEHDETSTKDSGWKTPEEISRLKRHEKVFTWAQAQGDAE